MALNGSGPISLGGATAGQSIAVELGLSATAQISLNDTVVRTLAGVASGAIIVPTNFYGKANQFNGTISSNQTNLNLRTWALANGWNGTSLANITIASGVYVYSTSTGTAGLTIDGSWPGGLTLTNLGFIMGQGGNSPGGGTLGSAIAGLPGGPAISLGVSLTIDNQSGYIAGGGGGGSSTYQSLANPGGGGFQGLIYSGGGGGAGGGAGGGGQGWVSPGPVYSFQAGGAGGGPGSTGGDGTGAYYINAGARSTQGARSGGGGGRIIPGVGGAPLPITAPTPTTSYQVGGGGGGGGSGGGGRSGTGGSGGAAGGDSTGLGGGGGGWGAVGGGFNFTTGGRVPVPAYIGGGAGGKAANLNGFTITWTGGFPTARIYGAVS